MSQINARIVFNEVMALLKIRTSLHTRLAAETYPVDGRLLHVATNREEFLKLRGKPRIPVICKRDRNILNLNKRKLKIVHPGEVFYCAGYKLQIFKKYFVRSMAVSTETVLTQGYQLPLNAFQLFDYSRIYRVAHS